MNFFNCVNICIFLENLKSLKKGVGGGPPPPLPLEAGRPAGRKAGTSTSKPWFLGWLAAGQGTKTSNLSILAPMVSSNSKKD